MSDQSPASDTPTPQPTGAPSEPTSSPRSLTGHTRIKAAWVAVIIGVIVLGLDLVFVIQNKQSVEVSFFTGSLKMPLGVALLLATVVGVLLAAIVGTLRIFQLRHRLHKSK